jgi:hypothetical protein
MSFIPPIMADVAYSMLALLVNLAVKSFEVIERRALIIDVDKASMTQDLSKVHDVRSR